MATNLIQSNLDTLYTACGGGSTGPYNEIGTDVGEYAVTGLSSSFEKNVATVIALVEFTVANTDDPSGGTANNLGARRQRKLLKDLLAKMTMQLKSTVGSVVDDRVGQANNVTGLAIDWYNNENRPDTIG